MNSLHSSFRLNGRSFANIRELLRYVEKYYPAHAEFLSRWFDELPEIELQTSGSTGKPKKIIFPKEKAILSARRTGSFFDLPAESKVLLMLSPEFVAGKMMWIRALTLGWHLDILSDKSGEITGTYDFSAMVPVQTERYFSRLDQIRKLIIGGAPLSPETEEKLSHLSTEIYATYGMTETLTHIAVRPLTAAALKKMTDYPSGSLPGKYYQIFPSIEISLGDDDTLIIEDAFLDIRAHTNDVVRKYDQRHFEWLGRKDRVINSSGIKIHPEIVERKLSGHIGNAFFVTGLPDRKWGEKLVLIVEGPVQPDIIEKIKNIPGLAYYEKPKSVYFIDKFVRSAGGKILRNESLSKSDIS